MVGAYHVKITAWNKYIVYDMYPRKFMTDDSKNFLDKLLLASVSCSKEMIMNARST
jgi:hypothetical protein